MTATDGAFDAVTRRELLAVTARAQRDGRLPSLTAAVTDDGGRTWTTGRGWVDGQRPTADMQYRIGSITKTFTAVLVLQLRDEGRLQLSDRVDRWLSDAPALAGRSVADLLTHTGGIRAETAPPWWERTPGRAWEQLAADLGDDGDRPAARGRYHYSNVGYAALGRIVAQVTGVAWFEALQQRILHPLGLRRTTRTPIDPAAQGWAVHPWTGTLIPEPAHDTAAMAPAGQLWSTTDDLAAWGRFLVGDVGDVIARTTLDEMMQPVASTGKAAGTSYGLGFELTSTDERTLVGHGGSMPGYLARLVVDRDERLVAVALANATTGLQPELPGRLLAIVRARHPRIVDDWEPAADPPDAVTDLLGVWYRGPQPYTLTTTHDPAVLALTTVGAQRPDALLDLRARPWAGRGGYIDGEPLTVLRSGDGAVAALELASFVFTREPYEPGEMIPGGAIPVRDGSRANRRSGHAPG